MSRVRFDRPIAAVRIVPSGPPAPAVPPKPAAAAPDPSAGKLEAAVRECTRALAELRAQFATLAPELEREAVALALAAAERVLGEEVREGRARIEALVAPAIEEALGRRGGGAVVVRLHPEDLAALRRRAPDLAEKSGAEFRADAAVARGSALVETAQGPIEAGVPTAMNRLREELLGGAA
jgi:flagellar assembly protein FliH